MSKEAAENRRIDYPSPGKIAVTIDAEHSDLTLRVVSSPRVVQASIVLTGRAEALEKITSETIEGGWTLSFPGNQGSTQVNDFSGGGTHQTVYASGRSRVFQTGGSMSFGNVNIGNMRAGGPIIVNGVDVSDYVKEHQPPEMAPLEAELHVPVASSLTVYVQDGTVTSEGPLAGVQFDSTSASLSCNGPVGGLRAKSVSGSVRASSHCGGAIVSTTSGRISLDRAGGDVSLDSVSGAVQVHATDSISGSASSVSGSVRITAEPGISPRVRGRSVSGGVSTA